MSTTKGRISEKDALYLGFLSKFPAADCEALSYLAVREENPFGAPAGELNSPAGVKKRMQKLERMGAVQRYTNPINRVNHFGITPFGHEAALFFGIDSQGWRGIDGLSISRLEHFRMIALIAAKFASPVPQFEESLGIEPLELDQIVSENEMRVSFESVMRLIQQQQDKGQGDGSFGSYRKELAKRIIADAGSGRYKYSDLLNLYPQLWTLGTTASEDSQRTKPIHQGDIALRLDDTRRTDARGRNWLIEVELSQKSPAEYENILRTFRTEFAAGTAYEKAIYFTNSKGIFNALKRADAAAGTDLITKKRLLILPIEGRNGGRKTAPKRVVVPRGKAATVPTIGGEDALPNLPLAL